MRRFVPPRSTPTVRRPFLSLDAASGLAGDGISCLFKPNAPWVPLWLALRLPQVNKPTRISWHAALDMAACAAFCKDSRMKFANATNLDRKSGEAAQANVETKEGWRARRKWM